MSNKITQQQSIENQLIQIRSYIEERDKELLQLKICHEALLEYVSKFIYSVLKESPNSYCSLKEWEISQWRNYFDYISKTTKKFEFSEVLNLGIGK